MQISLLDDRLLIQPMTTEQKMKSGLWMPETSVTREERGVVLGVGDKKSVAPIEVGDVIFFQKFAGVEFVDMTDGEKAEYMIIRRGDVIGILPGSNGQKEE